MAQSYSQVDTGDRLVTILWLTGGSCEGCSMSMLGATSPGIEDLWLGRVSDLPPITLVHPMLSFEAGERYLTALEQAADGTIERLIVVVEGSILDTARAGDGFFSGMGMLDGRPGAVSDWLDRLAPHATAMIAIGTCATWGGVPAARGNPTGASSLADYLGHDYRSQANLPIIMLPGCAPPGDNFVETIIYILLHLAQEAPLELDEEDRPRWLYAATTHPQAARVGFVSSEAATLSHAPVHCRVPSTGWMNHIGGCATVGGACNGCTMPGFPDHYLPLTPVYESQEPS